MGLLGSGVVAFLIFVLPVGIYCLVLASINRRGVPLMVSGFWDTAGLLFAASGFFLGTMPMLLTVFYLNSIVGQVNLTFETIAWSHTLIWLIYFLLVIASGVWLLLWRSHKTMIYNVDPDMFEHLFDAALAPLGLAATPSDHRLVIAPAPEAHGNETGIMERLPAPSAAMPGDGRQAELEVEAFPFLCHVTLHWHRYAPPVRREIEKELRRKLLHAEAPENPAASWLSAPAPHLRHVVHDPRDDFVADSLATKTSRFIV